VPYLHGLTAGELARMINANGWVKSRCDLTVVPMSGWQRWMTWSDTGLRWVPTSPNIPKKTSPLYYATTGILGGLSAVDIGIGTDGPFEYAGGDGIDPDELTAALRRLRAPGVQFHPYRSARKPGFAGSRLIIQPQAQADLLGIAVALVYEISRRKKNAPLLRTRGDALTLFHKVYGSDSLYRQLLAGTNPGPIISSWAGPNANFRSRREPYLLYA
jgi:uncharacterized protein YbbC (DUF1343 family)